MEERKEELEEYEEVEKKEEMDDGEKRRVGEGWRRKSRGTSSRMQTLPLDEASSL